MARRVGAGWASPLLVALLVITCGQGRTTLLHVRASASRVVRMSAAPKLANPPVINIAPLFAARSAGEPLDGPTVARIRTACAAWGFFYVTGHGVAPDLVKRFYAEKAKFFALPAGTKGRVRRSAQNSKGWYDDELTKNKRDWKEGFDLGAQDGLLDGQGLDGFNQWPDAAFGVPLFEPACREYFGATERVAQVLTRAMSQGLGMPPDHFDREFDWHTSYLRLNYYPVCPEPEAHRCISPHSDAGAVTVLSQSAVQSLQVEHDGEWHDVPPVAGTFVINTGDVMQVWSNGLYRAPVHRVIAQKHLERYSSPFFYNPNYATDYAPIASTVSAERPARYRPINWGRFRMARFAGDYADVGAETQISDFEIGQLSDGELVPVPEVMSP